MSADFTTVDKFNPNAGFNQVKFGADTKILETELNEMQKIQNYQVSHLGSALITNGFYTKPSLTIASGVLKVPTDTIVVNGLVYDILEAMTISVSSGDTIYLAITSTEVNGNSSLLKGGNLSGGSSLANTIYDTRMGGLETARRIQVQMQLTKTNTNTAATYLTVATMIDATNFTDNRVKCTVALQDTKKADKIASPVDNDLVAMDVNGNIKDAGKKIADLVLSADLAYPVATGTATALAVSNVTLTNNYPKTFIAAYNNGGASTTVNGKPLYRPGTTSAPTLTAGKAYTIWYNLANTSFFLKASAEGSALASQVLVNTTFSNSFDTEIPGAMANNNIPTTTLPINGLYTIPEGYHPGTEKVTQSIATKPATTYSPSTLTQIIPAGYYVTGDQTIAPVGGDSTVSNVLATKIFSSAGGINQVGTMPNNNIPSTSLPINGNYTIPEGYHPGTEKIVQSITTKAAATYNPSTSAQTIPAGQYINGDQTITPVVGDAAPGNVLATKIFSSAGGINQVGTMPNNNVPSTSLAINGNYTIPAGYHPGTEKIVQSIATKAAATYNPSTIAQTIPAGQYLTGDQTIAPVVGDANDYKVLAGYMYSSSAGINRTGAMPDYSGEKPNGTGYAPVAYPGNLWVVPPVGYYDGSSSAVTLYSDDYIASNILNTASIFGLRGTASPGRAYATNSFTHYSGTTDNISLPFSPSIIFINAGNNYYMWNAFLKEASNIYAFLLLSMNAGATSAWSSNITWNGTTLTVSSYISSSTATYQIWA